MKYLKEILLFSLCYCLVKSIDRKKICEDKKVCTVVFKARRNCNYMTGYDCGWPCSSKFCQNVTRVNRRCPFWSCKNEQGFFVEPGVPLPFQTENISQDNLKLKQSTAPANPTMAPQIPAVAPQSPAVAPPSPPVAPPGPAMAPSGPAMAPSGPAIAPPSQAVGSLMVPGIPAVGPPKVQPLSSIPPTESNPNLVCIAPGSKRRIITSFGDGLKLMKEANVSSDNFHDFLKTSGLCPVLSTGQGPLPSGGSAGAPESKPPVQNSPGGNSNAASPVQNSGGTVPATVIDDHESNIDNGANNINFENVATAKNESSNSGAPNLVFVDDPADDPEDTTTLKAESGIEGSISNVIYESVQDEHWLIKAWKGTGLDRSEFIEKIASVCKLPNITEVLEVTKRKKRSLDNATNTLLVCETLCYSTTDFILHAFVTGLTATMVLGPSMIVAMTIISRRSRRSLESNIYTQLNNA